jgi:hypothetical protein
VQNGYRESILSITASSFATKIAVAGRKIEELGMREQQGERRKNELQQ